ncbi:two-component system sensor histidine kinase BaeS [Bacillus pakistanensis]|uniref:histidine kinase n=1 Tax=Rossellomorea pakistanensis TaxID=992288 RepID=A0ABS2N6X9_9BACI|nr:HAMP domain-containing sensor histidine kinase [Bacillus pakistanensis]MBM7583574.1 two-component system sensor histidine kinase BaeS [Bacillus pakistanensis]
MLLNKWKFTSHLTFVHAIILIIMTFTVGLTVRNYACTLVNQQDITGELLEKQLMDFLIVITIVALFIGGLGYYLFLKWFTKPVKKLTEATERLKAGEIPSHVDRSVINEVNELNETFNSFIDSLKQVKQKQQQLLRDLSHELKTPLTNLSGYLEGLEKGIIEGDQEIYRSLKEETDRIEHLFNQLVWMSSWTEPTTMITPQKTNIQIDQVIKDIVRTFQIKFMKNNIDVFEEIEAATIFGVDYAIKQVMINLVQNIVDYDTGKSVRIKGFRSNESYILQFQHKGKRIPKNEEKLIFERFYRVDPSRTKATDGAGLGLSISNEIVKAHGGKIILNTDEYHHRFEVHLPLNKNVKLKE